MVVRPLFEFLRDNDEQHTSTVRFNYRYRSKDKTPDNLNILNGVVVDIPKIDDVEKRAKFFAVLGNLPAVCDIEYTVYSHCQERAVSEAVVSRTIAERMQKLSQNIDNEFTKAYVYEKARMHTLETTIEDSEKNIDVLNRTMEERKNRWFGLGKRVDMVMDAVYGVAGKSNFSKRDVNSESIHKLVNKQARAEDELFFWKVNSVSNVAEGYKKFFMEQQKGNDDFTKSAQQNQELENTKVVTGVSLDLGDDASQKLTQFFKSVYIANRAAHRRGFGVETKNVSKPLADYVYETGSYASPAVIAQKMEKDYVENGAVLPEKALPIRFSVDVPNSPNPNEAIYVTIQTFGRIPGMYVMEESNVYNIDLENVHEDTYVSHKFIDGKKLAQALHCGYKVSEYGHLNEKGQMEYEKSEIRPVVSKTRPKEITKVRRAVLDNSNVM